MATNLYRIAQEAAATAIKHGKAKSQYPELPAVVLSMHDGATYAGRALRAGALPFVMKKERSEEVVAALRKARRGALYVSEKVGGAWPAASRLAG